jgi:SMI1 / KNR4 family (SUKH-1)
MRCVRISTSDNRMDCRDMLHDTINPLPKRCSKCGFPDLDHVPQPYFLVKSRTMSPNELAGAENGNFFIRERVRRIFDVLVPGLCTYFPTCFKGTSDQTPWLLAVPNHQVATARVNPAIPRCESCGEPRSAHPGSQWTESLLRAYPGKDGWSCELDHDIRKSATWGSSESGWDQWISRDLYMSVRLLNLLKKIKAKGFHEATCQKTTTPDKEESAWITQKLQVVEQAGIPFHAEGTLSKEDAKWLRAFIETSSRKVKPDWDIKAVERRVKAKLPKSYLDFVSAVGPMSFDNVDEQEGFTASILTPDELEIEAGYAEFEDDESKAVNALTFASTGHGDCFCFDAQKGRKEFAVVLYKHEGNFFEPYAENFAACIKRFAGANDG